MTGKPRFASVDALRGLTVAAMLLVNDPGDWSHVYWPLEHSEWNGCTPTDLIFPFFLFIVGVSIAVGLVPRLHDGGNRGHLLARVWIRALRIVGLGLLLHAIARWAMDPLAYRPWGVLQRIGLCFGIAGTLALHLRARQQWFCIAVLLLGYWALLASGGTYAPWVNLASRVDTWMLGVHAYEFDAATGRGHDPEGLLSTLPAIATTLLGVRAGAWLRHGATRALCIAGIAALLLGALWALAFPINKNLWTSSYVLWSGGWAMLVLAAFHVAIDRWHWPAIGRSFGMNAITAYVGSSLMVYALTKSGWMGGLYARGFESWTSPRFSAEISSLAFAIAFVAFWWAIVWMMRKANMRLSI